MAREMRRLRISVITTFMITFLIWPTVTAGAESAITTHPVIHPDQDYAGSQISRYERKIGDVVHNITELTSGPQVLGLDVSSHQSNIDWTKVARDGGKFTYVKATEGTDYTNPYFAQQYQDSSQAGLLHGAYHFALPDISDGASQANYFADHGGKWVKDNKTLPPVVDMEYNPYGDVCYKKSPADMVNWVKSFSDQLHKRTGRYPMIYTSLTWWAKCTDNSSAFAKTNPLWIARYNKDIGELPKGWARQTMWQFADKGPFPGDQNVFNGSAAALIALARG